MKTEHPLTKFRQSRSQTLEAFADAIGAHKSMVWKWENGVAIPSQEYMRKIIDVSAGAVTANDWYSVAAE